ncbi:electron transfer flavoprotein subunit beta/FixA family protein [uncultured Ferrimonas sp.]|uniref:electron transfer flavoprotein subunit beta/FixA family protein n=1 Tax=uncultured Ferrimonas sp. TaxID=432640 RepID=UPI00260A9454|nr:electron transfer flavoprotein subunit beta/FixA family protein [uncultured Ferrimonas sp.]
MKILVAVKTIAQTLPIDANGNSAENNTKLMLDPFSEVALEQGLRMLEQGEASQLTVVSVSPSVQGLRAAMAMGCDHAIHIPYPLDDCQQIAKALQQCAQSVGADLVLLGKQSGDGDNHQVAQRLAALLQWPLFSAVDQLQCHGTDLVGSGLCAGGRGQYAAPLPLVISADLRLATPRFAALPKVIRARRLPITVFEPELSAAKGPVMLSQSLSQRSRRGETLDNVTALAELLRPTVGANP